MAESDLVVESVVNKIAGLWIRRDINALRRDLNQEIEQKNRGTRTQYISRRGKRWAVSYRGAERASRILPTKQGAVDFALHRARGGAVYIWVDGAQEQIA